MNSSNLPGILSIDQAADALRVKPIAVQRLIGLGLLPDNRNAIGSVVFQKDLEAYIGQGIPRLEMPKTAVNGKWYSGSENFVSRSSFIGAMMKRSDGIAEVTDKQIQAENERQRAQRQLTFIVKPTPAMVEYFNSESTLLFGKKLGYTFGVSALAAELRLLAANYLRTEAQKSLVFSPLQHLFSSPGVFKKVIETVTRDLTSLDIEFRESRLTSVGVLKNVVRVVKAKNTSQNWERDIARAVQLAF